MPEIRFMLVLSGFDTYIVRTPFTEPSQLQEWLGTIANNPSFLDDPLGNLPPKSSASLLLTEEELMDGELDFFDLGADDDMMLVEDKRTWDCCHGTLMVDDNDSIFYSVKVNKDSDWKLPFQLHDGSRRR